MATTREVVVVETVGFTSVSNCEHMDSRGDGVWCELYGGHMECSGTLDTCQCVEVNDNWEKKE